MKRVSVQKRETGSHMSKFAIGKSKIDQCTRFSAKSKTVRWATLRTDHKVGHFMKFPNWYNGGLELQ